MFLEMTARVPSSGGARPSSDGSSTQRSGVSRSCLSLPLRLGAIVFGAVRATV